MTSTTFASQMPLWYGLYSSHDAGPMHPHLPEYEYPHTPRRSFQTLGCFMSGIFAKRLDQAGFDVINILMGFEGAEEKAQASRL